MKVWAYLLRGVGAILLAHTLLNFTTDFMRFGSRFNEWDILNPVSARLLQPLALSFLCFGVASVLVSFNRLYRDDLEAQISEQRRLLNGIKKLVERPIGYQVGGSSTPSSRRQP